MGLLEIVRFAVRGLVVNRLRSLLTMLGIIIGIAAVILLTAVGNGASEYIQSQIRGLGANSITVLPRQPPRDAGTSGRPLTEADVRALADPQGAPDIATVSPVVSLTPNATAGRATSSPTLLGSTPSYFPGANVTIATGRAYDDDDVTRAAKVVVLGRTVADDLFGLGSNPVGQTVQFNGAPFQVIGTLPLAGQGPGVGGSQDQSALAPLTTLQGSLTGFGNLQRLVVQARSTDAQSSATSELESILDRRHGITNPDDRDFQVFSAEQLGAVIDQTFSALTLLLAAIAGISLVVGGIGITNIMLVSVTERTREIGIRKALGAPPAAILGQFLVEAVILSVIGGGIGVAIGLTAPLIRIGSFQPVILPSAVIGSVAVSAAIGVFFGAYPARRAARLRPIEALRRE